MNDGEDAAAVSEFAALLRQLAAQGDKGAALGRRLAASDVPPADVSPIPARTLLSLSCIAMAIQLSLRNLEKRQASGPRLSSEQLAGLLAWPAAVVAAPAVLPSAGHDVHGQLCMNVMPVITEHLAVLLANSGESAVHAAAQAEAHRQLPALVRACAHAAGRLAVSDDQYVSKEWEALLHFLALLVDTGKGYCQAAATALAAEGPGGKPGKQLAAHLLALLTSLVEAGPPASLPASEPISVPQGATGTGAAEAVAHGFNTLSGWDCLLLIVGTETFDPYLRVLTARGDAGLCLLSQLGGLLDAVLSGSSRCAAEPSTREAPAKRQRPQQQQPSPPRQLQPQAEQRQRQQQQQQQEPQQQQWEPQQQENERQEQPPAAQQGLAQQQPLQQLLQQQQQAATGAPHAVAQLKLEQADVAPEDPLAIDVNEARAAAAGSPGQLQPGGPAQDPAAAATEARVGQEVGVDALAALAAPATPSTPPEQLSASGTAIPRDCGPEAMQHVSEVAPAAVMPAAQMPAAPAVAAPAGPATQPVAPEQPLASNVALEENGNIGAAQPVGAPALAAEQARAAPASPVQSPTAAAGAAAAAAPALAAESSQGGPLQDLSELLAACVATGHLSEGSWDEYLFVFQRMLSPAARQLDLRALRSLAAKGRHAALGACVRAAVEAELAAAEGAREA